MEKIDSTATKCELIVGETAIARKAPSDHHTGGIEFYQELSGG